jgi:hypothetical protein
VTDAVKLGEVEAETDGERETDVVPVAAALVLGEAADDADGARDSVRVALAARD